MFHDLSVRKMMYIMRKTKGK